MFYNGVQHYSWFVMPSGQIVTFKVKVTVRVRHPKTWLSPYYIMNYRTFHSQTLYDGTPPWSGVLFVWKVWMLPSSRSITVRVRHPKTWLSPYYIMNYRTFHSQTLYDGTCTPPWSGVLFVWKVWMLPSSRSITVRVRHPKTWLSPYYIMNYRTFHSQTLYDGTPPWSGVLFVWKVWMLPSSRSRSQYGLLD